MSALPMSVSSSLGAFTAYGIEIEYMLVDNDSLSIVPAAHQLIGETLPDGSGEIDRGMLSWSNELVSHVIELKNQRPTTELRGLPEALDSEVSAMNKRLQSLGARLMPTGMHPWMDPTRETSLWPQGNREIYQAYDRIFDCRAHGWANVQSMHINLPFADDGEFARLHAAIRLVLPILPAIAASSPIADGRPTGLIDYRMEVYWNNAAAIPSIAGHIIPETITCRAEYETRILAPMYRDIASRDPRGQLQFEWLNSRGAIARFDRNAIEIRVIDAQECPRADIAIAALAIDLIKALYEERLTPLRSQQSMATEELADILLACIKEGEQAVIGHAEYLKLMGYSGAVCRAGDLWNHLADLMHAANTSHRAIWSEPVAAILQHGPLARRILRAAGADFSQPRLHAIYRALCDCLEEGQMFLDLD